MQSVLAPWLSHTSTAQHHTKTPANASNRGTPPQRRVLCNGIAQFPVWVSVPDDVPHLPDLTLDMATSPAAAGVPPVSPLHLTPQSRGTPHSHCLWGYPEKQATSSPDKLLPSSSIRSALSPPPLWLGSGGSSDDSDGPISRRARRLAIFMAKKRAAKAEQASSSPPPLLSSSGGTSDDGIGDDCDGSDGIIVDRRPVDLVSSSPRSQDSSSDSLSDFIDKSEPAYTLLQQKKLMRLFPITYQHLFDSGV